MNSTNRKAIEILKSKMTLEERKYLFTHMVDHPILCKTKSIYFLLRWSATFATVPSYEYLLDLMKRFTDKELDTKIDIK